jgi:thiol-disulfide isomerase/thioredoxin
MKNDRLDVRSKADVGKLMDLLKQNKIVLILVYADWCGHCQTFKKDVWAPLSAMPNRKVPLAAVNETMLAETPAAAAKIDGYPSVLMMGQDMKAAEFEGESGEPTNAMPNTRDLEAMKTIVANDPDIVLASGPSAAEPTSVQPTPAAEEELNNAAEDAINTLAAEESAGDTTAAAAEPGVPEESAEEEEGNASLSKIVSNPPEIEDEIASMHANAQALNSMGRTIRAGATASGAQEGGSLYYALLQAAKGVAPAAALAGTAIYVDKQTRRRGRGRSRRTKKLRR